MYVWFVRYKSKLKYFGKMEAFPGCETRWCHDAKKPHLERNNSSRQVEGGVHFVISKTTHLDITAITTTEGGKNCLKYYPNSGVALREIPRHWLYLT